MKIALGRSRRLWTGAAVLTALALVQAGLWSASPPAEAADPPAATGDAPVRVTLTTVKEQEMPVYRAGVGTAAAAATVTVKPRIDGELERIGFIEGQDVKAGQMLAQLDPRSLQAQLAQAEAQQAKDAAQLANARADLQRYTDLIRQDAATPQQLQTQQALVRQLEAAVQTDAAQVTYAKVQLGFTVIRAPMSGRVGARLVDPGNIVHASDAAGLVVINQIDPIAVVFTLPGDAVQDINRAQGAGQRALEVQAYARDGDTLLATGKLVLVNNQIDTGSGTVRLKASFANPAHRLWPGQYVNVRLVLGRRHAVTVPADAVQRGPQGTYAYVVSDDARVRMQPLKISVIQDGTAIVHTGLRPGERVVLDGQYKIKDGTRVADGATAPAPGGPAASGARR
jgi:multidrug efflux system membrane fusion protein